MDKGNYLNYLFDNIKDKIEFDRDIIALEALLEAMIKVSVEDSFINWKYVLEKYEIVSLMFDVDFRPLLMNYPRLLIKKIGLEAFFERMEVLAYDKKKLVYCSLFNIFEKDNFIYELLREYIVKKDVKREKEIIYLILEKYDILESVFDEEQFLKDIILFHVNNEYIDIQFLEELTQIPQSLKNQAVLKTLLLDYCN